MSADLAARIARAREVAAKATPGPLQVEHGYDGGRTVSMMRSAEETVCLATPTDVSPRPWAKTRENAALHALAVNALDAALARLSEVLP